MTDPKLLVEELRGLAEANREEADDGEEREDPLDQDGENAHFHMMGAASAYEDAANHIEEQLVDQDTVTIATVDFAFFQAQMAHALERAILRQEEEDDVDLDSSSVKRAHEQMLVILEQHAQSNDATEVDVDLEDEADEQV